MLINVAQFYFVAQNFNYIKLKLTDIQFTAKNKNILAGTKINIKISGVDIANITTTDGKINYEYTVTQPKGTYDITVKAQENNNYLYNAKHMTMKVTV